MQLLQNNLVGASSSAYVQDERSFAIEHMDVRREAFQFCTAHGNPKKELASSKAACSYEIRTKTREAP